jgi:peroxiredoxin
MNKKLIGFVILSVALVLVIALVFGITNINKRNRQLIAARQAIPEFHFYNQNLGLYNYKQIAPNSPVCIFYYDADCEFCQDEIKHLQQNIDAFSGVQILMVSANKPERTKQFANDYGLSGYKNIVWVYDKNFDFIKWFGHAVTPSVFIYGSKHDLIKEYRGEVKMEAVLSNIRNDKRG